MDKLTQISLFTGCGGIDLAFERAGFESLLQVEIDSHARSVLERHWPDVERIEDVRSVDGIRCKRPDNGIRRGGAGDGSKRATGNHPTVIHFGSPCQDLSVAGKRKGFAGDRSGLFSEAARIVREFDPDFAIWENVDGAFSSNGGRDFQSVLSHFAEAHVPMPRSGEWARAGMVRGDGVEVAWRTLDAQFFTVAQRRTRVFVIVDRRAQRAGEILFERTSLSGNTPPSGAPREEVAASLRSRSSSPGVNMPGRGGEDDSNLVIAEPLTVGANQTIGFNGEAVLAGFKGGAGAEASIGYRQEQSPTLTSAASGSNGSPTVVALKLGNTKQNGTPAGRDVAFTLDGTQQAIARTLLSKGNRSHDATLETYIPDSLHRVRRLTPTECERLQGMPDGWTEFTAGGSLISDTQRFKMIGNSVAVPVLEWIALRMAAVAEQG